MTVNNLIGHKIKFFLSKNNIFGLFFNLISSIFLIFLFIKLFSKLDFQLFLIKENIQNLILLFFLSILMIFLRSVRFKNLFFFKKQKINFYQSFEITCKAYTLNNLLPFRVGEFYRIYVAKHFFKIKYAQAIYLIILERFCDLIIIILFSLPFLLIYYQFYTILFLSFCLVMLLILIYVFKRINLKFLKINLIQFFVSLRIFKQQFLKFIFVTFFIYIVELMIYLSFILILGINLDILKILLIISISNLLPIFLPSPGGVGSFEYSVIFMMTSFFYIQESLAINYSFFTHFILIIPVTTIGILFFLKKIFINKRLY